MQPLVIARRTGPEPLSSRFATVLWPGERDAPAARALVADGQTVGVEVRHGAFRDAIIAPAETPGSPLSIDGGAIVTDAPFVVLRFDGDGLVAAQATGGTVLRVGEREIALRPELAGAITACSGGYEGGSDRILVEGLGAQAPPADRPILVDHANGQFSLMQAVAADARDGNWQLQVAEPPDFTVLGQTTDFHYCPVRKIDGRPALRIQPISTWTRE